MSKSFVPSVCVSFAVLVLLPSVPARGQDSGSAVLLHGQGVHAYFAGNSSQAERDLSEAIALNPNDPCLYYFRALSLLRLGRTDEARGDMMVGAQLEASRPGAYAVGKALERVQGCNRLLLEQYRRQARVEAGTERTGVAPPAGVDAGVLRQPVRIPLDEYLRPGVPRPSAAAPPTTFAAPGAAGGTGDDPFRDDPTPANQPNGARPVPPAPTRPAPGAAEENTLTTPEDFEADVEAVEETVPADEPPAVEADDPFSAF